MLSRRWSQRNAIPAEDYDDVIFGCLDAIGPLAGNIARTCWLAAGLPLHVPGVTIDRQCGSSQQAVHFAAQAVMSGTQDVVIAGGVQTMTQIPIGSAMTAPSRWASTIRSPAARAGSSASATQPVSQFNGAQMIADKWKISRLDMEQFALESHAARASRTEGRPLRPRDHRDATA